ncbi:MAG: glycosyltransferase family 4 protein [Lachnospiraceae bacterium]|nr:glycosyltransferase family 4 protein [Lachnospiraceae bacterium]
MKIGVLSLYKEREITGINKVTTGLMEELLKQDQENEYVFLGKNDWLDLDMDYIPVLPDAGGSIQLNYALTTHPLDIVHSHYRPFELEQKIPCAKILTIHDLIPLIYPQWYGSQMEYYDVFIRKSAKSADKIIAVSECTKRDISEYYGIVPEKIEVVYNGLSPVKLFADDAVGESVPELENTDFIFSVSGLGPHKNQRGLAEAFLLYKRRHPGSRVKLVLTGPVRKYEVVREILSRNSDVAEHVVFTGFVSDEQLIWLYRKSMAFIYVSYYEGFGLPILEALSVGKAVICAEAASMPEVGGDAVAYCDPHNVETIEAAIDKVVSDAAYRNILEKKALGQALKFSYGKAAEEMMRIYGSFRK